MNQAETVPKPIHPASEHSISNSNMSSYAGNNEKDETARVAKVKQMLDDELSWDLDVILLSELTEHKPLVTLGMKLFTRFNAAYVLKSDNATLRNWLTLIESKYRPLNPYHNSTHATDVLHATAYFISTPRLMELLQPMDKIICLIAAIVHDVDHPGKTNPYLVNTQDELALVYNDLSVLESYHASLAFRLTRSDPKVNILKALDRDTYATVRRSIIDMVLATDMAKHFDHLMKFNEVFKKAFYRREPVLQQGLGEGPDDGAHNPPTPINPKSMMTQENIILIKRILIKCADISNPTRPLRQCVEWSRRIAEEYFAQTDDEIARGLPVVLPMFNRKNCSIPKSQTGFIDYFVNGMYSAWNAFLDIPELMQNIRYNYNYWKALDKKGETNAVYSESIARSANSNNAQ